MEHTFGDRRGLYRPADTSESQTSGFFDCSEPAGARLLLKASVSGATRKVASVYPVAALRPRMSGEAAPKIRSPAHRSDDNHIPATLSSSLRAMHGD